MKKALCLLFALIFSINSFAAAVSDNDGSAFITKAEFDSLKNNFQQQLDRYNTSIDNKIDEAISSYLSGIKIEKNKDIEPYISNWTSIRFMHGPYMYFTNRRFTEYTTTAGRYVDTTAWQIINPENRRGYRSDGYLWWHDYVALHSSMFSMANITMMLHPYDVPWAYGCHDYRTTASRGPTIFAALRNEKNGWAAYASDGGFKGEQGHVSELYARQHKYTYVFPESSDPLGGINDTIWMWDGYRNSLILEENTKSPNDVANYTIKGINLGNASAVTVTDGQLQTIVRKDWNPGIFRTRLVNLWASGSSPLALKVACGAETYRGDYYSRVGNSLVEDNRWATEAQFNSDMDNFIYAVWGTDVTGDTNVAPPKIDADFEYLDLSESPNSVTVPYKVKCLGISVQTAMGGSYNNNELGHFQSSSQTVSGEITLTFPLFYRVNWADMLSGEFKYDGESLRKSDGIPILVKAPNKGNIKLKISYEEKALTDTSVVTLTPDQKIRTYFKNKAFSDSSSTYVRGYTNIDGTGTMVSLNGTEWTSREIKVNIPVERGESVWMRIDPLTSDGVYCVMTDYSCTLVTE